MRGNLQTLALILIMELRLVGLCVRNGEHDEFVPMLNSIKPVMWFEAFLYYVSMVTWGTGCINSGLVAAVNL